MTLERIDFYCEVEVKESSRLPQHRNKKGAVLGISEEEGVIYGYSVLIHGMDHLTFFEKDEIFPTGVVFLRSDFY
ncbi:hypothetical protein D3C84_638060 [compost metagenome]